MHSPAAQVQRAGERVAVCERFVGSRSEDQGDSPSGGANSRSRTSDLLV